MHENDMGVCVVGSRQANQHEYDYAKRIAKLLVDTNLSVVSGLAKGIDYAAHTTAIANGGRTVAVIGNGIDVYYPPENQNLQFLIERKGLVLSQFSPGFTPTRYSFPMRNAVMSAYAQATIIVTAQENSGTRHQAKPAIAHGRPLVLMKSVVENTSWGRTISQDPKIFAAIASNPEEAVESALSLIQELLPWKTFEYAGGIAGAKAS